MHDAILKNRGWGERCQRSSDGDERAGSAVCNSRPGKREGTALERRENILRQSQMALGWEGKASGKPISAATPIRLGSPIAPLPSGLRLGQAPLNRPSGLLCASHEPGDTHLASCRHLTRFCHCLANCRRACHVGALCIVQSHARQRQRDATHCGAEGKGRSSSRSYGRAGAPTIHNPASGEMDQA